MVTRAHNPAVVRGAGDWRLVGACRQVDPELFFAESEREPVRAVLIREAKAVCGQCPVLSACRQHGLEAQEAHGIWGGLTVEERKGKLRAQRWNTPAQEQDKGAGPPARNAS